MTKTNEAKFSRAVMRTLKLRDQQAYRIENIALSGLPDIYICNGRWIELKVIPFPGENHVTWARFFQESQLTVFPKLCEVGDEVFISIMWRFKHRPDRIQTVHWNELIRFKQLTMAEVLPNSDPYSEIEDHYKAVFRTGSTKTMITYKGNFKFNARQNGED